MRDGCAAAQAELERVQKQYADTSQLLDREMNSLRGVQEDLDIKVNVASAECAKWTDNTLQVLQYVLDQ